MGNKNNPIAFRVDDELYRELEKRVEQTNSDVSDYMRSILSAAVLDGDANQPVLDLFETDLRTLAHDDGDTPGVHTHIVDQVWETIRDDLALRQIRQQIAGSVGRTYVTGKGSSQSVAHWLAHTLHEENSDAIAGSPVEITNHNFTDQDTLVTISRSGETEALQKLTDDHAAPTTVAVTKPGTSIAANADHVVPLPTIEEQVENYATKSLVAQVAVLQLVVFDTTPDRQTLDARFDALDEFVTAHFKADPDASGLDEGSPFSTAVRALQAHDDITDDPIFGSLSDQTGFGKELELKFTEFAHLHAEQTHMADIRDRLLNLLFRDKAYLVGVIPDRSHAKRTDWLGLVFDELDSIAKMLDHGSDDIQLPLIAFSFTESNATDAIRHHTRYGTDGVIEIEQYMPDPKTRDLIVFAGIYLLVYGVLTQLWAQDQELKSHVIDSVYDSDTDLNWGRL